MPGSLPSNPRKLIGPSMWLLTLLVRFIPDSWSYGRPEDEIAQAILWETGKQEAA
jgi:hypothetical protein